MHGGNPGVKVAVILPAAGAGKRFTGLKQFFRLRGIPVVAHSLQVFDGMEEVKEILLVIPPSEEGYCRREIIDRFSPRKSRVVFGGATRQESVYNGLCHVSDQIDIVVVHDGVRPFITEEIVRRCIRAAQEMEGGIVAVPVSDTLKHVSPEGVIQDTVERQGIWRAQTPQAFKKNLLTEAHRRAVQDGFVGSDDASLVERLGYQVRVVEGSSRNLKMTTPDDLLLAEGVLGYPLIRTGIGYDVHPLTEGRRLILGGVEIPSRKGLSGHSDADALVHALCDALLGAMGEGDVGGHFPDTDPRYKDISSLTLLEEVVRLLEGKGYRVVNVDAVIMAEAPRLSPFLSEMRKRLAPFLHVGEEFVNIKAATNEKLGFVGREEGIAAQAVSTIIKGF